MRSGREGKRGRKKEYMKRGERWGEGGTGELFRQARSQWRWRGGRGCKESAREKTGEAGEPGETGRDRRGEWFARWEKQETRAVQAGQPARRYRRSRYRGDSTFFSPFPPSSAKSRTCYAASFPFRVLITRACAPSLFPATEKRVYTRHILYLGIDIHTCI